MAGIIAGSCVGAINQIVTAVDVMIVMIVVLDVLL